MTFRLFSLTLLLFPFLRISAQLSSRPDSVLWIAQTIQGMTQDEKIGQLFMVPAYSNRDSKHVQEILKLIQQYHVGGVIFMQGNVPLQLGHCQMYQQAARVPLLVAQDAEWGIGMRLDGVPKLPRNMTLGAVQNDTLMYQFGRELARQCRLAGVNVNFAPVFDVNNNPNNPVINYRSFGEGKYEVTRKAILVARGMEDGGILACAKHFPGHGDTDTDSHHDLPLMLHSRARLDSLELYPFAQAIKTGIGSFMVAHLYIPALDNTPNQPSTLSSYIIQDLLRDSLGYQGLIFTDALSMKGVAKYYKPGEAALQALLAGNDILLFPEDVPTSQRLIQEALLSGRLTTAELDAHVWRILATKYHLGLYTRPVTPFADMASREVETAKSKLLKKRLFEEALTLVRNRDSLIPLRNLDQEHIALVQIGVVPDRQTTFEQTLRKYAAVTPFTLPKNATPAQQDSLLARLSGFTTVILGVFDMSTFSAKGFGLGSASAEFCRKVPNRKILTLFGSPYSLVHFGSENAILVAFEEDPWSEQAAAAAIFGGNPIRGRLPVTASNEFPAGFGIQQPDQIRFGFALPEEAGMNGAILAKIDSIANRHIGTGAMPGCAVLVARGNDIVYERGFGKTTYLADAPVIDPFYHTYDLASVTKIAATTVLAMQLVEEGLLNLDARISTYLVELQGTNKESIAVRRLLTHSAGLPAWIPFYHNTYADAARTIPSPRYYSQFQIDSFAMPITGRFFAVPSLKDSVWKWIIACEVKNTNEVKYSDLGMIILGKIIERVTGKSLEALAMERIYGPMGMYKTRFRPGEKGFAEECPPTEYDEIWRHGLVQGFVHDQASAVLGGVSGHAGLFSNVYDMAKLMLMLKDGGTYGGRTYVRPSTVASWTTQQLPNYRRGLGFDKPEPMKGRESPASDYASPATYGHTGFTGICAWTDPVYDMTFIFLSNRTYPDAENKKLIEASVRVKMMDKIYEAMAAGAKTY